MTQATSEKGKVGLESLYGLIYEAYLPQLRWPDVASLYNRIYRSDTEVAICRTIIDSFANQATYQYVAPEAIGEFRGDDLNPIDAEKKAIDFANQVLEDMDTPFSHWISSCMSKVLFYGFGLWEFVLGLRKQNWKAPDQDDWKSKYDDGAIGIRRLAFRSYSSFRSWELSDKGYVKGFYQDVGGGEQVFIPKEKLLHLKYGDLENPEGLATLETIYRLEKIKYQLEIVQGIGFEHSAGYLDVSSEHEIGEQDLVTIRSAARAVMSAQQGNYALWPEGVTGEIKSTRFESAETLLSALRFYSILKLAVVNMQWATIGTISQFGTYSTMADATTFFITWFNTALQAFVSQIDKQLTPQIFSKANMSMFPGLVQPPQLTATRVHKITNLIEIGQFLMAIKPMLPLTPDDWQAIRRRSEFLQELSEEELMAVAQEYQWKQDLEQGGYTGGKELPAPVAVPDDYLTGYKPPTEADVVMQPASQPTESEKTEEPESEAESEEEQPAALAAERPFIVSDEEQPLDVRYIADSIADPAEIERAVRAFQRWASKNAPDLAALLNAERDDNAGSEVEELAKIDNGNNDRHQ